MTTLEQLNGVPAAEFLALLGPVFEHAPWVAEAVLAQRPFANIDALHAAMLAELRALGEPALLALLRGHPELAGAQARAGTMTADSTAEQGGLAHLDPAAAARWDALNSAYRERFGFPFILCIRRHTPDSALQAFEQRLAGSRADELRHALDEIAAISRLRLAARLAAG
ncbi:MAG TPA: 2-oxo-4-hydroxy-4-carboxy-5-ureidoimidazoline decarboxylase [Roseateles sp.]|nr:2-oxo-4-hydroxy-4-carboxy-5-ureidoimidazoline decarboxylase [Roseateles sp.]